MEDLFSIGEVSRYQGISKQTLIYYDKIGLFRPAYVDPNNGYRYYTYQQLDLLDTILILKKSGLSLGSIRRHLEHYTIDSSLAALRRQQAEIARQVQELQLIESRLAHRCAQMEQARLRRQDSGQAALEQVGPQCLVLEQVEPPYGMREISIATKRCFAGSFETGLPVFFQCGVVVPLRRILEGRCTQAEFAFVPTEPTRKAGALRQLPAGTCAAIYHVGDYLSIGRSYQKLLDFCAAQRLEITSDAYEFCVNDYISTHDESEYITKILFYVRPAENGQTG